MDFYFPSTRFLVSVTDIRIIKRLNLGPKQTQPIIVDNFSHEQFINIIKSIEIELSLL